MADYSTVARPYAKAVFGLASDAGQLAEWSSAIRAGAAVAADDDARAFLARPGLSAAECADFVASIGGALAGGALLGTDLGKGLLTLLAENARLAALGEISAQFDALKDRAENKIKVTLVSATQVDEQLAGKVAAALERRHGRKVELELETDPTLLGGAVVRSEDRVIDGSIQMRLRRLAESLVD